MSENSANSFSYIYKFIIIFLFYLIVQNTNEIMNDRINYMLNIF